MFRPITSTRIAQGVVEQFINSIAKGDFHPGDRLPSEARLAEEFGVSRACVREALRILEAMGIVRVHRGLGCEVLDVASSPCTSSIWLSWLRAFRLEVLALLEAREAVESKCSALAAERGSEDELRRAENLLGEARQVFEQGQMSFEQAFMFDTRFHQVIAEASHNPFLLRLSAGIGGALEADRMATMTIPGRIKRSIDEHKAILDAVLSRDSGKAADLMVQHIREVEEDIASLSMVTDKPSIP